MPSSTMLYVSVMENHVINLDKIIIKFMLSFIFIILFIILFIDKIIIKLV